MSRERRLTEVFVEITNSLVDDFDVVELLQTVVDAAVELLDIDAAALLLSDQRGDLRGIAASDEPARLLDLIELEADDGPCIDSFRNGEQVTNVSPEDADRRWPRYMPAARSFGYVQAHALPLRLRGNIIGAMNLLSAQGRDLAPDDVIVGQALCDSATICILQDRAAHAQEVIAEQLQGALNSRILVEQAKGMLAERSSIDTEAAFRAMRQHARGTNQPLRAVAQGVIDGAILDLGRVRD